MALRCAGLAAILCVAISVGPAFAQGAAKYEPPRTATGKPDLQGVWSSATATTATPSNAQGKSDAEIAHWT